MENNLTSVKIEEVPEITEIDELQTFVAANESVVNLTDERRHILQFFSQSCRRYYLFLTPNP